MAKKVGRKSKYDDFVNSKGLILVEGWAREGYTDEEIAKKIGISIATLYNWKNSHLEFLEVLKKSKEVVDFEVEQALLKKAKMGDTTAQIFWLKNRRPDKWRDKTSQEVGMKIENDGFIEALKGQASEVFKGAEVEE